MEQLLSFFFSFLIRNSWVFWSTWKCVCLPTNWMYFLHVEDLQHASFAFIKLTRILATNRLPWSAVVVSRQSCKRSDSVQFSVRWHFFFFFSFFSIFPGTFFHGIVFALYKSQWLSQDTQNSPPGCCERRFNENLLTYSYNNYRTIDHFMDSFPNSHLLAACAVE